MKTMIGSFRHAVLIFFVGVVIVGCSDESLDKKTSTKSNSLWAEGYPKVKGGAYSVDIDLKPVKEADIYYIFSDAPLELSHSELLLQAKSPTLASIKSSGSFTMSPDQTETTTIQQLREKRNYYTYIFPSDTTLAPSNQLVIKQEVTTKVRHDTVSFVSTSESRTAHYLLYSPEEALKNPDKKYPIIYYLAGSGERAVPDRPINLMRNGTLAQYIGRGNDVPMMVMSIQHATEEWNLELISEAITHAHNNLPVDKARQYLVGTSAGAFACWDYGLTHASEFAAIVPISGGGQNDLACNAKNMGVWAFHNQQDNVVGPVRSISMINDIQACPPQKEVKLTLFPDLGHNCWRRVFDPEHVDWNKSPDVPRVYLYDWLLQFSKNQN